MKAEIAEKLRAGGIQLYFDANAIRGKSARNVGNFLALCRDVKYLRDQNQPAPSIKVISVVYFELVHQLRREITSFDESLIAQQLQDLEVEVISLDTPAASCCARHLHSWHPTMELWTVAKTPANNKATLDWLISTHAAEANHVLVSNDQGIEFERLDHAKQRVTSDEIRLLIDDWLRDYPPAI